MAIGNFGVDMDNAHVLIAVRANKGGGTEVSMCTAEGVTFPAESLAAILRDYANHLTQRGGKIGDEDA